MAEQLAQTGVGPASPGDAPDIVVVNTCTVTREATKGSRSAIRKALSDHPGARVVVVGCYAVSDPDEVRALGPVDVVLGNDEKERLAEVLLPDPRVGPLLQIGRRSGEVPPAPARVRANLKVQTGCDEWCSFCIIPATRGPLRSLDADDLVAEARAKAAAGARELVLTGVHLGKFSYDRGGDERRLVDLLGQLVAIPGIARVRLSSILCRHLTPGLLAYMAAEPRVCRYLHVPLQSGDDGVLAAMNRPYRRDDYLDAVMRASDALPGLALATDIIVGFPGESDAAFERTTEVVSQVRFSKLHVFRYSSRPGTAAAGMTGPIAPEVAKQRSRRLIALGNELRREWLEDHVGPRLEVLVEDEREIDGRGVCSGQTDDHVRVWFEGSGYLGRVVRVTATAVRADGLAAVVED